MIYLHSALRLRPVSDALYAGTEVTQCARACALRASHGWVAELRNYVMQYESEGV